MIQSQKLWTIYYRIVYLFITFHIVSSQNIPYNPCPDYFSYQYAQDGRTIIGSITLDPPLIGESFLVSISLSVATSLPSQYPGSLQLTGSDTDSLRKVQNRLKLTYNVLFPEGVPIPEVTQILVNGAQICSGSPVQGALTTLNLQHTLNTKTTKYQVNVNSLNDPPSRYDISSNNRQQYNPPIQNSQPSVRQPPVRQPPVRQPLVRQPPVIQPFAQQPQHQQRPSATQSFECGIPARDSIPLVYAGADIERGEWPWLAAILKYSIKSTEFICGGNLISTRAVVSAAHCFVNTRETIQSNDIIIELGRYNRERIMEPGMIRTGVSQIIPHNDYHPDSYNYDADIAVLLLQNNVQYTEFIRPICLPNSQRNVVGRSGTVVGWGKTETDRISPTPKKVRQPIVSQDECIQSNEKFRAIISQRTFCAGDRQGGGPCKGDSGGGLGVYIDERWVLQGTVSASVGDGGSCDLRNYIVYCDVSKFTDWLQQYM